MKKLKSLNFDTHAHMKNIIGRDMINDDNIAVKELVKNSIDADATQVHVKFTDTLNKENPTANIAIYDNGKGMTFDDIEKKWLNLAFSTKRTDTSRAYAGNKGVGRFSTDRLGQTLHLYTRTKDSKEVIKLVINWLDFEEKVGWEDRIQNVKFESFSLSIEEFKIATGIEDFSGTYIDIYKPRMSWSVQELEDLKKDLQKFMIPNLVEGAEEFHLTLTVSGYDSEVCDKLSGEVANQVFEELPFKTSFIKASVDKTGKEITTKLYHRGELLIELKEKNPFKFIRDVSFTLFYLNPYHKAFFHKQTGMRAVEYGSIFLYLNGFRVPPYGDPNNDWLGIDRRRAQGHSRHLGIRDLLGHIEIRDTAGSHFEVTSDREGIKRNDAYLQLQDLSPKGFVGHTFRKLEKFVVEGLSWDGAAVGSYDIESQVDKFKGDLDQFRTNYTLDEQSKEKQLVEILDKIILIGTNSDDILSITMGGKAINILENQASADLEKLNSKLEKYSEKLKVGDKKWRMSDVLKSVSAAEKKIKSLSKDLSNLEKQNKDISTKLKTSEKQRLFAQSQVSSSTTKLQEVIHLTGHWGQRTQWLISEALKSLDTDPDHAKARLQSAQMLAGKTAKLSKIISKANFALMTDSSQMNIFEYISEYLSDLKELGPYITSLKITYENPRDTELTLNMSALEVSMLIDNIALNAESHKAKNLKITATETKSKIQLVFHNDGQLLTTEYPPEDLFKAGITTTTGSGMGLYQAKEIATNLDATITIKNNKDAGVDIIMEWDK